MVIVIFRSRVQEDSLPDYYAGISRMAAIAQSLPGYISHKSFTASDGERVSIHEWESEEHLAAWRNHPEHLEMQARGRDQFYEEYSLSVCKPLRHSRFKRQAP